MALPEPALVLTDDVTAVVLGFVACGLFGIVKHIVLSMRCSYC